MCLREGVHVQIWGVGREKTKELVVGAKEPLRQGQLPERKVSGKSQVATGLLKNAWTVESGDRAESKDLGPAGWLSFWPQAPLPMLVGTRCWCVVCLCCRQRAAGSH